MYDSRWTVVNESKKSIEGKYLVNKFCIGVKEKRNKRVNKSILQKVKKRKRRNKSILQAIEKEKKT